MIFSGKVRVIFSFLLALNSIICMVYSIKIDWWAHSLELPCPSSVASNSIFPFVSIYSFIFMLLLLFWKEDAKHILGDLENEGSET